MSNWEINEQERIWEIFPEAKFRIAEDGELVIFTNFRPSEEEEKCQSL